MSLQGRAVRKIGIAAAVLVLALSGWRAEARVSRPSPAASPTGLSAAVESLWSWLTSWFLPGSPDSGTRPQGSHAEAGCGMDPNGGMWSGGGMECPQVFRPGSGEEEAPPLDKR